MKKQLILFAALLFSVATLAQSGERLGKRRNDLQPFDMQSINSGNIEFTISRSGEKILVTARAAGAAANKWDGKVQGRIIFRDSTEKEFIQPGQRLNLVAIDEATGKTYNLPLDARNQFGGTIGGPIVKDKLTLKYSLNGQPIAANHSFKFGLDIR